MMVPGYSYVVLSFSMLVGKLLSYLPVSIKQELNSPEDRIQLALSTHFKTPLGASRSPTGALFLNSGR